MPLAREAMPEPTMRVTHITRPEQAEQLCDDLRRHRRITAFDTETIGHDVTTESPVGRAQCICWSLCHDEREAFYIHNYGEQSQMVRVFKPWFEDESCLKQGHNIKYDMHVLANYGIRVRGVFFDSLIGAWLVNEKRRLDLESLCYEEFGEQYKSFGETFRFKPRLKNEKNPARSKNTRMIKSLAEVIDINDLRYQPGKLASYAAKDAWLELRLANRVREQLDDLEWLRPRRGSQREQSMFDYYSRFECPFLYVLFDMERSGVFVDMEFVKELDEQFVQDLETLQMTFLRNLIREGVPQADLIEFNIGSRDQLSHLIYDVLGYPPGRVTDKGKQSIDATELERLVREGFDAVEPLRDYQVKNALISKFTRPFPKWVDKRGRIHSTFKQHGARTGRLSSSTPNVQNIPRDSILRCAFGAPAGHMLVQADLSQIEYRMMAHYCNDRRMIEGFYKGEDFHIMTAKQMFPELADLSEGDIKKEHNGKRQSAKTCNFAILFGQGPWALAEALGLSEQGAKDLLFNYFGKFPGLRPFIDGTKQFAREHGHVRTLLRRYRRLPDITSPDKRMRAGAERQAVNTVIQGSAADWVKMAMILIHQDERIREYGAEIQLMIHDELVLDCPRENAEAVKEIVVHYMQEPFKYFGMKPLRVPVVADSNIAMTWAEAK